MSSCYTTSLDVVDFKCTPNFGEDRIAAGDEDKKLHVACMKFSRRGVLAKDSAQSTSANFTLL
jgi:hypothetical protein